MLVMLDEDLDPACELRTWTPVAAAVTVAAGSSLPLTGSPAIVVVQSMLAGSSMQLIPARLSAAHRVAVENSEAGR